MPRDLVAYSPCVPMYICMYKVLLLSGRDKTALGSLLSKSSPGKIGIIIICTSLNLDCLQPSTEELLHNTQTLTAANVNITLHYVPTTIHTYLPSIPPLRQTRWEKGIIPLFEAEEGGRLVCYECLGHDLFPCLLGQ